MSTPCGRTEIFDFEEGAFISPPTYVGEGIIIIVIPNCGFWQEWSDSETRPREGCVEPADLPIIQDMFRNLLNFWDPETSSGWQWWSDVTIPITRIINYSVILSECEESHFKNYEILRQFALALNGYGSAFILELVRPQYDKMDWRFTPIH